MKKKIRKKLSYLMRKLYVPRKYRDKLFRYIFRNKRDLLELYNAVNNTHYTDEEALEITTLEDVIYLSMKNDLSFIISCTMNLYEHQSTFNPNIPMPQFIVFYNGRTEQSDEIELKLSSLFINDEKKQLNWLWMIVLKQEFLRIF